LDGASSWKDLRLGRWPGGVLLRLPREAKIGVCARIMRLVEEALSFGDRLVLAFYSCTLFADAYSAVSLASLA